MNRPINPGPPVTAFSAPAHYPQPVARPSGLRRVARAFGGLIAPVALLIVSIGCLQFLEAKQGNGNVIAEERVIEEPFEGVSLVGSYSVNVTVDETAGVKVVVTTDENLLIDVNTVVKDGVLVIDTESNLAPTRGIRVDVTIPSLASARVTGSGDMVVTGIKAPDFTAKVTGSGDIQLAGTADIASLSVMGSGEILAEGLDVQKATARVTGSGDVIVTARQSADAKISGSGDIVIAGKPANVTRSVTGSGDVTVK